jgi:hypothetical protein
MLAGARICKDLSCPRRRACSLSRTDYGITAAIVLFALVVRTRADADC